MAGLNLRWPSGASKATAPATAARSGALTATFALWLAVTATFRYVSLASMMAAACVPLGAVALRYPAPSAAACVVAAALVVARHRDNIARLAAGTERRLCWPAG